MPRGKKSAMKGRRRVSKPKSKRTYRKRAPRMTYDNLAKCSDMMTFGSTGESSATLVTDTAENYQFNLKQFPRAQLIASQYQEFKIDYVEVRIKPYFDTFNSAVVGTIPAGTLTRAPQLYKYIIKTGELAPASGEWFRANGVNAMTLAKDRNIKMRYKPAIRVGNNTATTTGGAGFSTIKVSPWLATNDTTVVGYTPNTTIHYGHAIYIDSQQDATVNTAVCQVEIEAHFLFRKPNAQVGDPSPGLVKVNGEVIA